MPYNSQNHPTDSMPSTPSTFGTLGTPDTLSKPRNTYHWNAQCQRSFLEALAGTGSVAKAAKEAGKSPRAAYTLRTRKEGALFRLAWDAAILLARDVLGDVLLDRAIYGNEEMAYHEGDGQMVRIRYDNHLGTRMLTRLDHMAQRQPDNNNYQARVHAIAGDFETYMDLIECGDPCNIQIMDIAAARIELGHLGDLHKVPDKADAARNNELNNELSSALDSDLNSELNSALNSALNCELSPISAAETHESVEASEVDADSNLPDDKTSQYKNRAERRANNRACKRAKVRAVQATQIQADRNRNRAAEL